MNIVLTDICVYPVKALAGISCPAAEAETRGLVGDRRWVIVDAAGKFISQRSHPALALVRVTQQPDGILLTRDGLPPLRIAQPDGQDRLSVSIWQDVVDAAVAPEADAWLSTLLGEPCRLAWMDDLAHRPVSAAAGQPQSGVSFADGYPCLLISEASLAELNRRLSSPVPMNRFRPNLVVAGCGPFSEDSWTRIAVGEAVFRVVSPCARCSVTTVEQSTGQVAGPEPLRTLASFRKVAKGVLFGVNLVVEEGGLVAGGDAVRLLA